MAQTKRQVRSGNAVHVFQQQLVIGPVVAVLPGIAGAVDARRAAQRIHGKAAVVRQRGKAGGLHDAFGLDAGVFLKGGAVFVNIALKAHFLHGDGLTHAPEQGGQLLKLMGVARWPPPPWAGAAGGRRCREAPPAGPSSGGALRRGPHPAGSEAPDW